MPVRDDLPAAMLPWLTPDFQTYLETIGDMFAPVETYVEDTEDGEGWTILLDPDRAPVEALPYLAQYVGERLPPPSPDAISEARAREWVKDAPNRRRGTVRSIFYAAQRTLTGSRLVTVRQRLAGDEDAVQVITYTDQTPDPDVVLADILEVFPAELVLTYSVLDGQSWGDIEADYATWTLVEAEYSTWAEAEAAQAGDATFGRP
jgi:hypothetical protein